MRPPAAEGDQRPLAPPRCTVGGEWLAERSGLALARLLVPDHTAILVTRLVDRFVGGLVRLVEWLVGDLVDRVVLPFIGGTRALLGFAIGLRDSAPT
ncbi:MAG TPA: hypothetical protein VFU71_14330 [Burkholderiaceae bacterium]|nr:hypothetical protein [Burkholderiaceae bacterium]